MAKSTLAFVLFCFFTLAIPAEKKPTVYRLHQIENFNVQAIDIRVDDSTLRMVVDTGASRTLLSPAGARKISLQFPPADVHDLSGVGLSGHAQGRAAKVRIGDSSLTIVVMPLPYSEQGKYDGILGSDYLSQFDRIQIDYRRHELTVF